MIRAAQLCLAILFLPCCINAQDASFRGIGVGMSIDSLKIVLAQLKKTDYWSWSGGDSIIDHARKGALEIHINTNSSSFGCVEYAPDDRTCLSIDFVDVQLVNGAVSSIYVAGEDVNSSDDSIRIAFNTFWSLFSQKFGDPSWVVDYKSKKKQRADIAKIRREACVDLGRWSFRDGNAVEFYICGVDHGTSVSPWLWMYNPVLNRLYHSVREQQRLHPQVKPEF